MYNTSPLVLDLETVILRCMKFWSRSYAEKVCCEYRRYLVLALNHDDIIPARAVDDFWHQHILDTEKYRTDSVAMNLFLDHTPELPGEEDESDDWEKTLLLYKETFGETPPKGIWG